jgi:hypothetical protein
MKRWPAVGTKKRATCLASIPLGAVLLLMLSGCGVSTGVRAGGTAEATPTSPDSVRIEIDAPSATPPETKPAVTLTDAALVRQLYATIYALPALPDNLACTAERGPHYTLTFRQSTAPLVTVQANRDGCRPVTIVGATPARQATSGFWQQLDQAIFVATPPLRPDRLAIAFTPHAGQAPQSAQITTAAMVLQFYDAILALPLASAAHSCLSAPVPTYQLVFFAGAQTVPAFVDDACHTITVEGGYQSRGGSFTMTVQFRSTLQSVLDSAALAPARPDQLVLSVVKDYTTSHQATVSDTQLMLALYDRVFTLPAIAPQPGCPPNADKLAHTGTYATLTFTQWKLQLVQIATYEGSCSFIQLSTTGQWLQADQAFWDLVHRALAA